MLSKIDIQIIIHACRRRGYQGILNGKQARIPELQVDYLAPPEDFLGVGNNPAIFVNHHTHAFLGRHHQHWIPNRTIAVKESLLLQEPIQVMGTIIHEVGHAFNVAANISNTESNAYLFEIDVMLNCYQRKHPLLMDFSKEKIEAYFESRLPNYRMDLKPGSLLSQFVQQIEHKNLLNELAVSSEQPGRKAHRLVVQSPFFTERQQVFFSKGKRARLYSAPLPSTEPYDVESV